MFNILIFLVSCALVAGFTWYFLSWGESSLVAWISVLGLLANIFVLKQITLFGLNATASDAFTIGSLLGLNLLEERYGAIAVRRAIGASFGCLLFFVIFGQLHLQYQPSSHDTTQEAYALILGPNPRIILASLFTFLVTQLFNSIFFRFLRQHMAHVPLMGVSSCAIAVSQLLDTVLFSLLGLYGLVDALWEIVVISYSIKLLALANTLPWSWVSQHILAKKSCH